jgi:hypothetical protein
VAASILVLYAFICYWPLTRFYLAQDDFILLERADQGFREAMSPYFHLRPGQFRPVTKGLYFLLTWPVFGLNPFPYHLTSLLLHALNGILVGVVLRRLGISVLVSWLTAGVFVAHLCHLEAVAWASCVQQLIGAAFVFATLVYGLDAMAGRGQRAKLAAAIAYGLALGSYEQTLATPLVLLAWQGLQNGLRAAGRAAWGPLRPMLLLMMVYVVYAFMVRGMPDSGPYVMGIGSNVLVNLRDYNNLVFSFWHSYPAYMLSTGSTGANMVWIVIAVLHLVFRTHRVLVFGCVAFLALLAPVLFTRAHTHSFHLYLPEFGVCVLLASLADSLASLARERWRRVVAAALIVVTVGVGTGSVLAVRRNTLATINADITLARVAVLRRAQLAERMCAGIRSKWRGESRRLILMYPGPAELKANWRNVYDALGQGSAVRLVLRDPELDVLFVPPAELPTAPDPAEVLVFTELGHCFTWWELENRERIEAETGP